MHLTTDTDSLRRVAVIGTSCSGKTTLAHNLSHALACPRLELDAVHWGPDWTEKPHDQMRREIDVQTDQPAWVCCGNYSFLRDIVWRKADTIVWLNYSFPVVASRALRRTLRRSWRREELWNGNRESFRRSFFSYDSILLWGAELVRTPAARDPAGPGPPRVRAPAGPRVHTSGRNRSIFRGLLGDPVTEQQNGPLHPQLS